MKMAATQPAHTSTELHDNPCAQELHYRQRVLAAIPTLKVFDRHVVQAGEVAAAKRRFGKRHPNARKAAALAASRATAPRAAIGQSAASPVGSSNTRLRATAEAPLSEATAGHKKRDFGAPASKISRLLQTEAQSIKAALHREEVQAAQRLFESGNMASRTLRAVAGTAPVSALTATLVDTESGVGVAGVEAAMAARGVDRADATALARAGWGVVTRANQQPLTASLADLATRPDFTHAPVEMEFRPTAAARSRAGEESVSSLGVPREAGRVLQRSTRKTAAPGLGPWEEYHLR